LIGSITHTAGYCAAAVAHRVGLLAVGLDSETVGDVTRDLWPTICGASEAVWLASLPEARKDAAATLIFSAKEAFYKCQFPLTQEWLDFHDLIVEPSARGSNAANEWASDTAGSVPGDAGEVLVRATRRLAISDHAPLPMIGRYRFHERFVTVGFGVPA
jgi:4'-phosphopantetheinyl transferase EntD